MKNKRAKLLLSCMILNTINVSAGTTCELIDSIGLGYVGDTQGKRFSTKERFNYNCIEETIVNGECSKWSEEKETNFTLAKQKNVYYKTDDFSGSMGKMLAITEAYDKINGIWSGWKGICRTGKDDNNWDWLSDPATLAGYALTIYTAGASADASETAKASAEASQAADEASDYKETVDMIGTEAEQASANAEELKTVEDAEDAKKVADASKKALEVANYTTCAITTGINVEQMIEDYKSDGIPCDPVDEMCGEEESGKGDEQIFTIPTEKYNEMIADDDDTDPNSLKMKDYLKVISGYGTETLTIKVINPGVKDDSLESEEAEKARKKIKLLMLKIQGVLAGIQLASCLAQAGGGSGVSGSSGGSTASSLLSAQNLGTMALNQAFPLAGMAFDIASKTFESVKNIDTCSNRGDAKDKGDRHVATMDAKKYNLCHFIQKKKSGSAIAMTNKTIYTYCCYDSLSSRTLVEQAKAQLGHNWNHCTGLSLKELTHLKFRECDYTELDKTTTVNGITTYLNDGSKWDNPTEAKMKESYQYKNECIDTREYMSSMLEKFGGEDMLIDSQQIEDTLKDFKIE